MTYTVSSGTLKLSYTIPYLIAASFEVFCRPNLGLTQVLTLVKEKRIFGFLWVVCLVMDLWFWVSFYHVYAHIVINLKGKRYFHTQNMHRVLKLIPVLGSQPTSDWNHQPSSRLPLLSLRPVVNSTAAEHRHPLVGTKLYCLVTDRCVYNLSRVALSSVAAGIQTCDLLIASLAT